MDAGDSGNLDDVIDGVARAMTSADPRQDVRSAVASRIAGAPSRTFGWRVGLAAASIVAVVLVAAVLRPRSATQPPPTAEAVSTAPVPAPVRTAPPAVIAHADTPAPRGGRRARAAAARQVGHDDAPVGSIVEIAPVAILPLAEDRGSVPAQARIEIAPIAVEPVRIRELGAAE